MDNWVLQVEAGPDAGRTFPIPSEGGTIGRQAGVEIALTDPLMSRRHARLDPHDGRMWVTDLGSSNGTRRNSRPVEGTQEVRPGDLLELGDTRLRCALAAGVAETADPPAQSVPPPIAERQTVFRPTLDGATMSRPTVGDDGPAIAVGSLLNGRYRLDRQIGRGGFARVYLATDLTLGRPVAAKVLAPELVEQADERDFLARFAAEARAVALLDHPNILSVFDYGQAAGTAFLVMPYVEGGTLYDRLRESGPLDPALAAGYLRQVAGALDYAHRRNLVHRDIKPQNMLLRAEDERLLLADFGIAKVLSATSAQSRTGIMGTVGYMAPEQFKGEVERATDLYALGCVLFQLLTGQLPFQGPTERVMYAHLHEPVPPLASRGGAHLSPTIQPVLDQALAKAPGDRFASAGAFAAAFAAALGGEQRTTVLSGGVPGADDGRSAAPTQIALTPPRPLASEPPTVSATPPQALDRTRADQTPSHGPVAASSWPPAAQQTTAYQGATQVGGYSQSALPPTAGEPPIAPSAAPQSARISRRAIIGGIAGVGLSVIGLGGLLAARGAGGAAPTATAASGAGGAGTAVPAAPAATAIATTATTAAASTATSALPTSVPTATTAPTVRPSAAPFAAAAPSAAGVASAAPSASTAIPSIPRAKSSAKLNTAKYQFIQNQDFHPDHNAFLRTEISEFCKVQGWNLDISYAAGFQGTSDLLSALAAAVQAGSAPDAFFHDVSTRQYEFQGVLEDTDALTKEAIARYGDTYPGYKGSTIIKDKWYGLPFYGRSGGTYVRRDILKQYGLDVDKDTDTYDKLRETALKISDPTRQMWGWGMTVNRSGDGTTNVQQPLMRYGSAVQDETGQLVKFNSPETIAGFQWLKETYSDKKWEKMWPSGLLSWTDPANNEAFLAGTIGITDNSGTMYAKAVFDKVPHAKEIVLLQRPIRTSDKVRLDSLAGARLHIVKGSKNKDASADLLRHLISEPVLKQLISISPAYVLPPYKNLWKDPLVQNDENARRSESLAYPASFFPGLHWPGPASSAMDAIGLGTYYTDAMAAILQGKVVGDVVKDYHNRFIQLFKDFGLKGA